MSKAKWIWYSGDFEIYHHMLLACRRQELGCDYPCMWRTARPEVNAAFVKKIDIPRDSTMFVHSHSKGFVRGCGGFYPVNCEIPLKAGYHEISIELYNLEAFPSLFIDSEYVKTDESWTCQCGDRVWKKVGCSEFYTKPDDDPAVFPFSYYPLPPAAEEKLDGGTLYDFAKETYGIITLGEIAADDKITLIYGESREEALDYKNALVRETLTSADEKRRPARAFRYIFIKSEMGCEIPFTAEYEYLPIEDKAAFSCDDEEVEKIFRVCSYTFHLNSREFYLDGIKRDRWVWSGDAYQSFFINRYLYAEPDITRRTITALLGKPPYNCHINTINDYSAYLIIALLEYFEATADSDFVNAVWDKIKALYAFILSRLDERGYVVERPGDWIFIDWGDVDKSGTLCAEQLLLWQTHNAMAKLSAITGEEDIYSERAFELKEKILRDFREPGKTAFFDCPEPDVKHYSKQTNTLAILFDFVGYDEAMKIKEEILDNDSVTPITTPYFKLYELIARCKCGDIEGMQSYMKLYWGGMLKAGATTIWEQYDPTQSGTEHYRMYGKPYGKSLCHAWGSGPIYLLGRFVAGVYPTSTGGRTFTVEPNKGLYKSFKATVPVGGGTVRVTADEEKIAVFTALSGGTLKINGSEYEIKPNELLTAEI